MFFFLEILGSPLNAIGISLGIVCVFLVSITCFCVFVRKRTQNNGINKQLPESKPLSSTSMSSYSDSKVTKRQMSNLSKAFCYLKQVMEGQPDKLDADVDLKEQLHHLPYNSSREIGRNQFEIGEEIGKGNFGTVCKGKINGLFESDSQTTVAIKSVHGSTRESAMGDFLGEIKIMSHTDPHVNLVSMIGACTSELSTDGSAWLLVEFCHHGDLKSYLIENEIKIISGKKEDSINSRCLIKWSYDIANGMQYLAKNQIMHGDLAARNVVLDDDPLEPGGLIAMVADFGLSKRFYGNVTYEKETRLLVPWKWMALEYLTRDIFTLNSDVWSFGVLFWEIFSFGRTPYGQQGYDELLEQLENGYRLQCPKQVSSIDSWNPKQLYQTVSGACFVADPLERASFQKIVTILEKELSTEELEHYKKNKDNYQLASRQKMRHLR